MADNRTVELEIRAQDYSGKTINEVRKNIKELKNELSAQAKAASKGKADFKQYELGLKGLSEAAQKLSGLQAIASKLDRLGKDVAEQSNKAETAAKAYSDLSKQIGKLGVPTEKQATQLNRLNLAQLKAAETAQKHADAYNRQRIEAEAYGLKTKNIQQTQDELAKSYQRTLQTIIEMRATQSALVRENDAAANAARAKYAAEREALDKNNAQLKKNLELWRQQKQAIEAARNAAKQRAEVKQQNAVRQAERVATNEQRVPLRKQVDSAAIRVKQQQEQTRTTDSVSATLKQSKGLDGSMTGITSSVRNAQKVMRDSKATAEQTAEAMKRLKAAQEQMLAVSAKVDAYRKQQSELNRLGDEYRRLLTEYRLLNNAMRNGVATDDQLTRLRQLVQQLNQTGAAYGRQKASVTSLGATLTRAGIDINNLAQAEQRLVTNASRSAKAGTALSASLNKIGVNAGVAKSRLVSLNNESRTALSFMQRLRGQVLALAGAYAGVNGAIELFKKTLQAGQEGMILKIRTEVLADGWEASAKELETYFRETAERMGLELSDVIQDASKLFVAAKENGYSVNEAQFTYEQFSGLGQLMGADAETQKGITKALSDMFAKGTIQAEELKGQLGDRLPQAMALFAKATGKSNAELMEMMKNGELTADYIIKAAGVIKEQYGAQMESMYHTLNAEQARVNNAFQDFLRLISDTGVLDNFKALLVDIAAFFRSDDGKKWADNLATAANAVIDALRWCVKHTDALVAAFGILLTIGASKLFVSMANGMISLGIGIAGIARNAYVAANAIGLVSTKASVAAAKAGVLRNALLMKGASQGLLANLRMALPLVINLLKTAVGIVSRFAAAFLVFKVIAAVFDGIVKGIEQITGKTIDAEDKTNAWADSAWLVSEAFSVVSELVTAALEAIVTAVSTVTSVIVGLFVDSEDAAEQANKEIGISMSNASDKSESSWTSALRNIAQGMDALRWIAKTTARYVGGWMDWVAKKLQGVTVEIPDWSKIAEDTALEVAESGSESRFNERLKKKAEEKKQQQNATEQPDARDTKAAQADAKLQAIREKAEQARQRAEEAALKRLEKELSYEKMLQKLIDYRKGKLEKDPMAGKSSLGDWFNSEADNVKSHFATIAESQQSHQNDASAQTQVKAAQTQVKAAQTQAKAAQTQAKASEPSANGKPKFIDPIKGDYRVSSKFGYRQHPIYGDRRFHSGVDMAAPIGTDVHASAKGVVSSVKGSANDKKGYGLIVTLKHEGGMETRYAHLSKALVKVGQVVEQGQHIAEMGSSGGSTGSHLHFETRRNGQALDPLSVMRGKGQYSAAAFTSSKNDLKVEQLLARQQEYAEQLNEKVSDAVREAVQGLYKAMGVNGAEGLISRNLENISLDLSESSLTEIINGFQAIIQPNTDRKAEQMLELLTLDYQKRTGKSREESFEWSKQLEPKIQKYAQLEAQKGMREQVDAFVGALEEARNKITKEQSDGSAYIANAVANGSMSITEAQNLIASNSKAYADKMAEAMRKLDDIINNPAFGNLPKDQQTAIMGQREQLRSEQMSNSPMQTMANAAVDTMATRLDNLLAKKNQYEMLQQSLVESGSLSITQMERNIEDYLSSIKPKMEELVQMAQQMMAAFGNVAASENMANLANKLNDLSINGQRSRFQTDLLNKTFDHLENGAMSALDAMSQGFANIITGQMSMREALQGLGRAFAQWAAETLKEIAKVILQHYLLLALKSAMGQSVGSIPSLASRLFGGGVFHTGGIVGGGKQMSKKVDPLVFAGATRYHSGGIAGLAPNEVPAILQKGEEVLTKNDPRHRDNGGTSGGGNQQAESITVINTFDPNEALRMALKSSEGRKILVNAANKEQKAFRRL